MFKNFRALIGALALATALTGGASAAAAQTIGQTNSGFAFGNSQQGQSFTATVTGTVTQIAIRPSTSVTGDTLRFYNGSNGTNVNASYGTPITSQTVNTVAAANDSAPLQTITLSTPLPVVAGNTYSFVFASTQLRISNGDTYAGGTWTYNYNQTYPSSDAAFQVTQVVPTPVPTMSEWAMILLGLTLAGGAAIYIQRRRLMAYSVSPNVA